MLHAFTLSWICLEKLFIRRVISRIAIRYRVFDMPNSITACTTFRTCTQTDAFGRFSRMLVCPVPEPTHSVSCRDTTSNAQCALRDSLGISGRGSPPRPARRRWTHGVHPRVYACRKDDPGCADCEPERGQAGRLVLRVPGVGGDFPERINRFARRDARLGVEITITIMFEITMQIRCFAMVSNTPVCVSSVNFNLITNIR